LHRCTHLVHTVDWALIDCATAACTKDRWPLQTHKVNHFWSQQSSNSKYIFVRSLDRSIDCPSLVRPNILVTARIDALLWKGLSSTLLLGNSFEKNEKWDRKALKRSSAATSTCYVHYYFKVQVLLISWTGTCLVAAMPAGSKCSKKKNRLWRQPRG
jgi:hypothetical protein